MKTQIAALAIALGATLPLATAANAVPFTEFSIDNSNGCGGGCTTGPFGTIFVYDLGGGTLQIDATITNNWFFIGGASPAFALDLSTVTSVAYSNVTTGWTPASGSQAANLKNMDGRGSFDFGLSPPNPGGSSSNGQQLSFDITATGLTLSNLVLNNQSNYFGMHIGLCDSNGTNCGSLTGYAGAAGILGSGNQNPPGSTPLPAALPLFASGLGLIGFFGSRRKRRTNQSLAA
jgi:hypothetical protein